MVIIGFGNKCRSGKDTAISTIISERGHLFNIKRYAFADALKEEIAGREAELCFSYGIPFEPEYKHRYLLQFWGSKRRKEDPFYWVRKLNAKMKADLPTIAIISDLRMMNEYLYAKSQGAYTVRINRLGYPRIGPVHEHESETQLDKIEFDFDISVPDGDVKALQEDALEVFDTIVAELDLTNTVKEFKDFSTGLHETV